MKIKSRVFRHKKTTGLYRIVSDHAVMAGDGERLVIYRNIQGGPYVVRTWIDFDQNFEEVE